jgi:TRAP-type transport system small permease protein
VGAFFNAYEKLCARIDWVLRFITIAMFVTMTTVVVLGILSRFTGLFAILWSEEVGRYLMIWMGFLGAVMALRRGQHIGVLYLVEKLPRALHNSMGLLVQSLCVYFLWFMVTEGVSLMRVVSRTEQASPMSDIPLYLIYGIIPITGILMIVQIVFSMVQTARGMLRPAK